MLDRYDLIEQQHQSVLGVERANGGAARPVPSLRPTQLSTQLTQATVVTVAPMAANEEQEEEERLANFHAQALLKSNQYKQNNARKLRKLRALLKWSRKDFRTLNKLPKKHHGKQRKLYWQTVRAYSDLKR